jgi:hypothetical protein
MMSRKRGWRFAGLVEYNSLVTVAENASFKVPANGAGENDALEVATSGDKIFNLIAMGDAGDVLLNDRAVVENVGYVMAGRADQLDSARGRR